MSERRGRFVVVAVILSALGLMGAARADVAATALIDSSQTIDLLPEI